jgi:hypothetical protein
MLILGVAQTAPAIKSQRGGSSMTTLLRCVVDDVLLEAMEGRLPYKANALPGPYVGLYHQESEKPAGYVVHHSQEGRDGLISLEDDWRVVDTRGKTRQELTDLGSPQKHAFQERDSGNIWPTLEIHEDCILVLWNGYPMQARPGDFLVQHQESPSLYGLLNKDVLTTSAQFYDRVIAPAGKRW